MQRLFVYGTLAPGRSNEHWLKPLDGHWQKAKVKGRLLPEGWGLGAGYPGLVLDPHGPDVHGHLFTSPQLKHHWSALDDFEGEEYHRTLIDITLESGETVKAYIYEAKG